MGGVTGSTPADEAPASATPPEAIDGHGGGLRRRAAFFYGLIVCGAVLAADPENIQAWLVGVALVGTVVVYWIAETYVHWVAARAPKRRGLTAAERWKTVADGFPLVLACGIPAGVVFIEAVAGVPTATAVQVALLVNVALLVVVGWLMSPTGRPLSPNRFGYAIVTGLLGVAMIGLKTLLHH
jgi:hypothetical protein